MTPMTQFSFTVDYDVYGQPSAQIVMAVPRGRDFRVAAAPGKPYLSTHTVTTYAHRDDGPALPHRPRGADHQLRDPQRRLAGRLRLAGQHPGR